jgi:hypothetical protein
MQRKGKGKSKRPAGSVKNAKSPSGTGHSNPVAGFAASRSVIFAYGDNYELTNGAGVNGIQVWNANGLYDPDYTNVGHQPRAFDQLLSADGPYTRFCVRSCTVTVVFRNEAADFGLVGLHYSTDYPTVADFSDFSEVTERAQTFWKPIAPAGQPGHIVEMTCHVPISALLGRAKVTEDDDTCGSYNADPSRKVAVCAFVVNDSANADCTCVARLDMDTRLFGRAQVVSS